MHPSITIGEIQTPTDICNQALALLMQWLFTHLKKKTEQGRQCRGRT